jgi:hypothetical protein
MKSMKISGGRFLKLTSIHKSLGADLFPAYLIPCADAVSNDASNVLNLLKYRPSDESKCKAKMFFGSMVLRMRRYTKINWEKAWG